MKFHQKSNWLSGEVIKVLNMITLKRNPPKRDCKDVQAELQANWWIIPCRRSIFRGYFYQISN